MNASEWFRLWFSSPYYDILYRERNNEEAAKLTDKLVDYLKIPRGSFILDAACGKGRHSIALASKGFDVTGVDICAVAIEEAKKYETDKLHFYLHDIRLPLYINYFDYAFNFFTSFGYFGTMREHNDALRTIAQSLRVNGIFTIDYLNAAYTEKNLKKKETIDKENVVFEIERWCDDKHFFKRIHITDKVNNVNETFTEQVEKFSLNDFGNMLSKQKLQVIDVFGDYELNAHNENNSARMIIAAKKINM